MTLSLPALLAAVLLVCGTGPSAAAQQHGGAAPGGPSTRPPEAASQFDFLIGHWELTVTPAAQGLAARIHGVRKLQGSWRAWRALDGWGIEDELRIVDASGNPMALTHFLRVYDGEVKKWRVTAVDAYRAKFTNSTALWQNGEMHVSGDGLDEKGETYLTRVRIRRITKDSFQYVQDRSTDAGKSWSTALTIDAKRVAALAPR